MRRPERCIELVARTPEVILEIGEPQDYTHLQRCGAPATKNARCRKHQKQPNTLLDLRWRRFLSRQV